MKAPGRHPSTHPALELRSPSLVPGSPLHDRLLAFLDDFEPSAIDEDTGACRVFFASPASRDRAAEAIRKSGALDLAVQAIDVPDENWAERSQVGLAAVRVGRIIVAPPWDQPLLSAEEAADGSVVVITILPSTGFGTGHHESTRLALQALQALAVSGLRVVDAGTGSGVLALAASRLGAASVLAIDPDADALDSAVNNLALNPVAGGIALQQSAIEALQTHPADLVLANLTGTLLARHASAVLQIVRPGGHLVVSGFTVSEEPLVRFHLVAGGDVVSRFEENDWIAFILET